MYRILELNPQLEPFSGDIDLRMHLYRSAKKRILPEGQSLNDFANAHMYFGFHHVDGGWYYREWAPSAYQLYLEGEFNGWNQTSHPLTNLGNGNWELYLPGDDALWDGCKVKTVVDTNLTRTEHIPLYARRVVQNKQNITFECEVVDDRKAFPWTDKGFTGEDELYIYEAHIGMAQEEGKVGSYREFADNILPRIHKAGYNTLQLMAIMEHPYYGSFGYQVSSFFAASSWFGKPEDLKYLVNKAHAISASGCCWTWCIPTPSRIPPRASTCSTAPHGSSSTTAPRATILRGEQSALTTARPVLSTSCCPT